MGESDVEETPREEVQRLDEILTKIMEENGGVQSFVGVMGFSQGGEVGVRVTATPVGGGEEEARWECVEIQVWSDGWRSVPADRLARGCEEGGL